MLEIYTPSSWYSLFRCPKLVIADDGLIYNENDYYKVFRNAIGKIDYADGYIYGEDYCSWPRSPIGRIKQDGDLTLIYGDDYARLMAQPIFYIRDNRIYAADEFFKLFPAEAGFISGSMPGAGSSDSTPVYTGTSSDYSFGSSASGSTSPGFFSGFLGKLVVVAIALVVLAIGIYFPIMTIKGEVSSEEDGRILITCIAIGAFMAFFLAKEWLGSILHTFWWSMLFFAAMDVYNTYQNGNFTVGGLILTLLLGVFVYGLVLAVPSALAGTIVWFIRKPFVKKAEGDDGKSPAEKKKK